MSEGYEEILRGETVMRFPPSARHEVIAARLHRLVSAAVAALSTTRLLERRSVVQVEPGSILRPDLALVTAATGKLWLAAEIVNTQDHRIDTVIKKQLYEERNVPRLWMIDPRYDNVEVYHGSPHGLILKGILANREMLREALLPSFEVVIRDLFNPEERR